MWTNTLSCLFLATLLAQGAQPPQIVTRYCSGCHENGENAQLLPYVPRLAGQHSGYLAARLQLFRQTPKPDVDELLHVRRRSDASMTGITHAVSPEDLAVAARWYSSLKPAGRRPSNLRPGRDLYVNGLPSRKVPSCASCHDTESAPVIAGQHASYLLEQLELFRRGIRSNPRMATIARCLTNSEREAVVEYAQGLFPK